MTDKLNCPLKYVLDVFYFYIIFKLLITCNVLQPFYSKVPLLLFFVMSRIIQKIDFLLIGLYLG